jgi:hypothetical protein
VNAHHATDAYANLRQLEMVELIPGYAAQPSIWEHMGGVGFPDCRYKVQESVKIPIREESENAYPVRLVAGDGKSMKPTHDEDGFLLEVD